MKPSTCYAHACTVAEVEVDDETGEVTVVSVKNVFEIGRALNPKMVEQQLVGGSWMGISHALYETTEPYYPKRDHGGTDFNEYLMPGPGDIAPTEIVVLERPAADGPYGAKGPGEMCANPQIPARRQRGLRRGRRAHRHAADHARAHPAGAEGTARRRRALGRDARHRHSNALRNRRRRWPPASPPCATSPTTALRPRSSSPSGSASRCCSKARRASARRRPPRRSPRSSARELVRLQCYEGIDAAHALYEWNYQRQLLAIRQAGEREVDIYDDRFLIARPLLQVLQDPERRMLLVDEIDRSDHEFEALLLEFLSDFQITHSRARHDSFARASRSWC